MAIELYEETGGITAVSQGTGSNPISVSGTVDGSGGTVIVKPTENPFYVRLTNDASTIDNYTSVEVSFVSEDTGIDWEVSDDDAVYGETLAIGTVDVSVASVDTAVYFRAVLDNASPPSTNIYEAPDVKVTGTSNPV